MTTTLKLLQKNGKPQMGDDGGSPKGSINGVTANL